MNPLEYSQRSPKRTGLGFFAPLLLLMLFAATVTATTHTISSLPYEFTSSDMRGNDTLKLASSGMSTGSKAIDIGSGCDGLVCDFRGRSLSYGSIGMSIHSNNIKVVGGTFLCINSGGDGNRGMKLQGHDIVLEDVTCMVSGDNAIAVWSDGVDDAWNLEIDGGTYWSEGTGFENRCWYDAPVMKFTNMYSADASNPGFQYHVSVHDATIDGGPWAGIAVLGRETDDNKALAHIYNNSIMTDHINDWYDHYSGTCLSSANPYGVIFRNVAAGSYIINNVITSGTAHGGNRGILIERSTGTIDNPVIVRKNYVDVHEGPNVEYSGNLPVHGLRIRYANHYVTVDSNTFIVTADDNSGTAHTGWWAHALRLSATASYTKLTIRNNTVIARSSSSSGVELAAMVFDAVSKEDCIFCYDNNITSAGTVYQFECDNGSTSNGNIYIEGDTAQFAPGSSLSPQTFDLGWLNNSWISYGHVARDLTYLNGAGPTDIDFSTSSGQLDISIQRTLKIYVRGSNGLPVVGATVTARNNYGQTVVSGTTDNGGRVSGPVTYRYEANGWFSDSTNFNDFRLSASLGGDSDGNNSFTVGWTRAGGTDTLTLSSTVGTGEWGASDPEPDPDTTPPAAINNLVATTGAYEGSIDLNWSAPGDDGNIGIASSYTIRYSSSTISESNWGSATTVSNPPIPSTAGTSQSKTISGLVPGNTYYIGIKTTDEYGNQSPLSNIASAEAMESAGGPVDQVYRTGAWTQGLTHNVGSGDNRILIFAVGYEDSIERSINGVTYGGQAMTRVAGAVAGTGTVAHGELWYLTESGIGSASSNSFNVIWGNGTASHPAYAAATFVNVNQGSPIVNVSTAYADDVQPNPITTSVNVMTGGLALGLAVCGNGYPYSWNNGWTEGFDVVIDATAQWSAADHQELLSGTSTASATNEDPNRQVLVVVSLYPSTGGDPGDTVPPARIIDLGAEPGDANGTINLGWTAPGDDNDNGNAAYYVISYSTQPIDESNWFSADVFANPPAPGLAGTMQSVTVNGLVPATLYYLAIKAVDDNANTAEISNIVSAVSKLVIATGEEEGQVILASPKPDSTLNTSEPTLFVANVDTETDNLYYFEVSTDSGFSDIVAVSPAIAEEPGVTTSWKVSPKLTGNQLYFWRARVDDNLYSDASYFRIEPRAHAYPNPFQPSSMDKVIFAEVPDGSDLVLMQVSGNVVRRWTGSDGSDILWDGTNESGSPVASGTYLWFVENTDQKGKLIVVR